MSLGSVPEPIARYLERALPEPDPAVRQVRVVQSGEMLQRAGGRAMRFTAVERFAVERVAFAWEARFPLAGPLALRVTDGCDAGYGALTVRALGLRLQRQAGRAVALGEAYRYLAELPWAPHAMATNRELGWRALGDDTVEVSTPTAGGLARVRLEFDATGDIVRCLADGRPRLGAGPAGSAPWGGELGAYRVLGGIRVPTAAEVFWELPAGRFTYWRGRVEAVEPLAEPFTWDRPIA